MENPNTAARLNISCTGGLFLSPPHKESCRDYVFFFFLICSLPLATCREEKHRLQRAANHSPAYFFKG